MSYGGIYIDKELTLEEKLTNAISEGRYQQGRADGMREMFLLINPLKEPKR